jgi:glycosyltransferase involved in cell wall biosynthesis
MTIDRPSISVVIASHNARSSVEKCLGALVSQCPEQGLEIVVVDNSTDGTAEIIQGRFPDLKLIEIPPSELVPTLWSEGIRQSTGKIVAITTAHFVPASDWVDRILEAHETPVAAVGGTIDNNASSGVVDWAVYFCRYSGFIPPMSQGFVLEIAGDNASYKREYLERHWHTWQNGFWEPAFHAALREEGAQLLLTPSMIVYHKRSFGLFDFLIQRFQHGRRFGGWRASVLSRIKRVLFIALSPAIPFVLQFRIVRQVLAKRRHLNELILSFPIIAMFTLSWTLGELTGYLLGPTK